MLFLKVMFSKRFKWNFEKNQLTELLEKKKHDGETIFDFTESNPTKVGLKFPHHLNALNNSNALIYEPEPRGLFSARRAVAKYYAKRNIIVDADNIHLTASTSEAYSWMFKLLTDKGQSVLVPHPGYPLFEFLATLEGVELIPYHLEYYHSLNGGWSIDFDSLKRSITSDTRAIVLVNPNNPTGSFIKRDELAQLNELCSKHKLAIISDEVFSDYAFDSDERYVRSLATNDSVLTFVMSGLSKVLGMPQMKLGWVITNGPKKLRDEAIDRLDLIADTFLSVNTPVQHASVQWLQSALTFRDIILDRVTTNLDKLKSAIEGTPLRLLNVEGGWYATLEVPRIHSEEEIVLDLLDKHNVYVHPGYFFDFPKEAYLVFSLLPEQFQVSKVISNF